MSRTASDEAMRKRIEAGIAIAAPFLDLALAVMDRLSRVLGPGEPAAIAAGVRHDGGPARRGLGRSPRPAEADDTPANR